MKNKTKKTSINVVTLLIALTMSLIFVNVFFVYFVHSEADTTKLLKEELKVLEQNERIISSSTQIYDQYQEEIEVISDVFPNEESVPVFIQDIEQILRENTTEYTFRFSTNTPLKEKDKLFLPLSVTVKTDMAKLLQLLSEIERMPYMLQTLNISSRTPEGLSGMNEVTLNLKIYVQNPFNNNK